MYQVRHNGQIQDPHAALVLLVLPIQINGIRLFRITPLAAPPAWIDESEFNAHEPPIVRTGSTDKHLIYSDEPIHAEPLRRPRTYRDLDPIPNDLE